MPVFRIHSQQLELGRMLPPFRPPLHGAFFNQALGLVSPCLNDATDPVKPHLGFVFRRVSFILQLLDQLRRCRLLLFVMRQGSLV